VNTSKLNNPTNFKVLVYISFLTLPVIAFCTSNLFAQVPNDNSLSVIADQFRDNSSLWLQPIRQSANRVFWILAGISFTYQSFYLAFRGSDIKDVADFLVFKVLNIGFFYALLINSSTWSVQIINSFRTLASSAVSSAGGLSTFSPPDIFDAGVDLALKVGDEMSIWSPASSVSLMLASLIVLVAFALIAAEMLVLIVQMYVVINAGVIIAGFGGAVWMQGYAVNFLKLALSIGVQLFLMQLIVGMGQQSMLTWASTIQNNNTEILTMIGMSVIFFILTRRIPALAVDLLNGSYRSGSSPLAGISPISSRLPSSSSVALQSAGGAMAGLSMLGAGYKTASAELSSSRVNGHSSGQKTFNSMLGFAKGAGMSAYQGIKSDLKNTLTGERPSWGTMGGRVANSIKNNFTVENVISAKKGGEKTDD